MTTPESSLRNKVFLGVKWNVIARVVQQFIQFLLSIILARLLLPEDFGIVGMIAVFTGVASLFVDMGFGSAIVQRQQVEPRHLDAAFMISLLLGGGIAVILLLAAPMISQFYQNPQIVPLVSVAALNFLFIPFGMVPGALLQKAMQFNQLARIEIITMLFSGVLCVLLALLGWGVWSLLAQALAANLAGALLKWRVTRWMPKWQFDLGAFRDLWGYSINLFGFSFINYWARNSDNLLVGRFLGAASLGIYNRAYSLMLLPISQVISIVASVMFPALSSIQEDKPRVKRIYLEAMDLLSFVIFPIMIGLSAVAAPFILTVYGEKWAEVIPLLQILALVGLLQSLVNPLGWIYTSQGQTRLIFWVGTFNSGVFIASIVIGASLGSLLSLALCYAIANVLLFYHTVAIPGRFIDMSFGDLIRTVSKQLTAAVLMGMVVWVTVQIFTPLWSPIAVLFVAVGIGGIVYVALSFALRISWTMQMLKLIGQRFAGVKPTSITN